MAIKKVKLKTLDMYRDVGADDADYSLWREIAGYMDGKTAFVIESEAIEGAYVFLGLADKEQDRYLHYMFEQDSRSGVYIDSREQFDRDWDSGAYEPGGCHYLNPENVEILEREDDDGEDYEKK